MLDNKSDTVKFINKVLKTKLKEDDIEKYNSSFVNKIFQNQEADIVYKIKNKNIFFLIEQQTKIDYSMPYRILEYQLEIIKSAIDIEKLKNKSYKIPQVYPIVLYTGKRKWNAKKFLEDCQEKLVEIDMKLTEYFAENQIITRKDFQYLCGMTQITAYRHIKRLMAEKKLQNKGTIYQPIYTPVPGNYRVSVDLKYKEQ